MSRFAPAAGLKRRLRASRPARMARRIRDALTTTDDVDYRVVRLEPEGPARGTALVSYVRHLWVLGVPPADVPVAHTHYWELRHMVDVFLELGYGVHAIDVRNRLFTPERDYSIFVANRWNMQRLAPVLNGDCLKVLHADTAHVLFQNAAESGRLLALQRRRGVTLRPHRQEIPNLAVEHADCVAMLGNEFTAATWTYAGKPIYPLPVPMALSFPPPEDKDFREARRRFVWMGSYGFVHKGLDLVLEAFVGMPEYELVVCGDIGREPDFVEAFDEELHHTPNIRCAGWVDLAGPGFRDLARDAVALVYPSCSEGGGGTVVHGLAAGLIPIVSYESSVDVDPAYGVLLEECTVPAIRDAVRQVAGMEPSRLAAMARAGRAYARERHSAEAYRSRYRSVIETVTGTAREPVLPFDRGRTAASSPAPLPAVEALAASPVR